MIWLGAAALYVLLARFAAYPFYGWMIGRNGGDLEEHREVAQAAAALWALTLPIWLVAAAYQALRATPVVGWARRQLARWSYESAHAAATNRRLKQ